jgi:hypothetical protein
LLAPSIAVLGEKRIGAGRSPGDCVRKVTNCFRSEWGAEFYANIQSVMETARRRSGHALEAMRLTLFGTLCRCGRKPRASQQGAPDFFPNASTVKSGSQSPPSDGIRGSALSPRDAINTGPSSGRKL